MQHSLDKISNKPSDYTKCKSCGKLNWYESPNCCQCGESLDGHCLTDDEMMEFLDAELDYWTAEGFSIDEALNVDYDI